MGIIRKIQARVDVEIVLSTTQISPIQHGHHSHADICFWNVDTVKERYVRRNARCSVSSFKQSENTRRRTKTNGDKAFTSDKVLAEVERRLRIEAHRKMKWGLAMRIASHPEERWTKKAAKWNPGRSSEIRTSRRVGRPKKRWEEETKGNDLKSNDTWPKTAEEQKKWK